MFRTTWSYLKNRKKSCDKNFFNALSDFQQAFPLYQTTAHLDILRNKEFSRLSDNGHIYLDFTGASLYPDKLVADHARRLTNYVFGNPHSSNPTSKLSTNVTESARDFVLRYLKTNREEYVCIFTQNASGALKLLGESYPFEKGGQLLMTFDNHNSVNGIREFARESRTDFTYTPMNAKDLRIDQNALMHNLIKPAAIGNKLFAFPAQSNVSGVKHDLEWIQTAQQYGWDVLLDAAAFVPSDRLDLSRYQPDFVTMSFYKIFGYPTGLGCLLVRRQAFEKLRRPWFAGGTIKIVSVQGDAHSFDNEHAMFEDGTLNFLDIPAIESGLSFIENLGIESIRTRISCLTGWTLRQLLGLVHHTGIPLVKVYGPLDMVSRGGTLAMNFFDEQGHIYEFIKIEKIACERNISLRTGCFCNPGIDETNHGLEQAELKDYFNSAGDKSYFDLIEKTGKHRGAVRISFGYISNFADAYHFIQFAKELLNKRIENKNSTAAELIAIR